MPKRHRRAAPGRARFVPLLALLALAVACSSQDQVTSTPVPATSVTIEGLPASPIVAGQSVQLKAIPLSAQGDRLTARAGGATWQTSDANIATINSSGMLTGVLGGQVTVSVSVAGIQGSTSASINNPAPQVTSLSPASAEPGDSAVTLTITGTGFVKTSTVQWNGQARQTSFVSPTQLTIALAAADLANEGSDTVRVVNPAPGGGAAPSAATFNVRPAGLTQIAAFDHTCALSASGQAYCWGANAAGQIGDGTTTDRSSPVAVQAAPAFTSISTGRTHTCAVSIGGQVFCWGGNASGQLGNGSTQPRSTPAGATQAALFKQVTAGSDHTCTLRVDGAAFCWGSNTSGQLGIGRADAVPVTIPTPVQTALRFRQLSAGYGHTCGIAINHQAYCWGRNDAGQIGNGSVDASNTAPVTTPVAVQGGRAFRRVSAGSNHTCAITDTGDAYCWGDNSYGEGGTGASSPPPSSPQRVTGSGFTSISTGVHLTCAVQNTGDVFCWGSNGFDRAGAPDPLAGYTTPQRVTSGAVEVAAGESHTCAILTSGSVACWGFMGPEGRLGEGSLSYRLRPVAGAGLPVLSAVAPGETHSCALSSAGQLLCWGLGIEGELADGGGPELSVTPKTASGGRSYTQLSSGTLHSCALSAGKAYCWGNNAYGSVGDGGQNNEFLPTLLSGSGTYQQIVAGAYHTCALTTGGQVQCWGYNGDGETGNGTVGGAYVLTPAAVQGNPAIVTLGSGPARRSCGVSAAGQALCWGSNDSGALGNGSTNSSGVPVAVPLATPLQNTVQARSMTCGLTASGQMYCWGAGYFGNGTFQTAALPTTAGNGLQFKQIAAGVDHLCGVTPAGQAYCWGSNNAGQLGTGDLLDAPSPVPFAAGQQFQSIAASHTTTCGLTSAGAILCAGDDLWGQLGDGKPGFTNVPARVSGSVSFSLKGDAVTCGTRDCAAPASGRPAALPGPAATRSSSAIPRSWARPRPGRPSRP